MSVHLKDGGGEVHASGSDGNDYALCGYAMEGEYGYGDMEETAEKIDCPQCVSVIAAAKKVRSREIRRPK